MHERPFNPRWQVVLSARDLFKVNRSSLIHTCRVQEEERNEHEDFHHNVLLLSANATIEITNA
ncbi:MAG TPA: hypothetical protein VM243_21440 [Phycisphaerae bacterium]|nr:hypothetical protein [Phycisphaerae bacterium]